MKNSCNSLLVVTALVASIALSSVAAAQEEDQKSDKTGTNPINFSKDFRVYNEFSWLNTAGDGTQNPTTAEYRTPFAGGKWQWRVRARYNALIADVNNDGIDDIDDSGFGDVALIPFAFYWTSGDIHMSFAEFIITPTGDYGVNKLISNGLNCWSFDTNFALTYLNPQTGRDLSLTIGYIYNTENDDTD